MQQSSMTDVLGLMRLSRHVYRYAVAIWKGNQRPIVEDDD